MQGVTRGRDGAIGGRKQAGIDAPISWARGDFSAFSERKEWCMRKKSRLSDYLNRGLRRAFRAELGFDDGEEKMSIERAMDL